MTDTPGSEHKQDVADVIESCELFLFVLTPNSVKSAKCYVELEIAKQVNKDIRILIQRGTEIPEGFLDGIGRLRTEEFEGKDDIVAACSRIMEDLQQENG